MIKIQLLLVMTVVACTSWIQQKFKKIQLYKNDVLIEVPKIWKLDKSYPLFSNYQAKYYLRIGDKTNGSVFITKVFDSSHMQRLPIDVDMLSDLEKIQVNTKGRSIRTESKEVRKLNKTDIGILRYTFLNSKHNRCFGTQMIFRTTFNDFYEIDIFSLNISAANFEGTVARIWNSLEISKGE